jgi:hypothetical protein
MHPAFLEEDPQEARRRRMSSLIMMVLIFLYLQSADPPQKQSGGRPGDGGLAPDGLVDGNSDGAKPPVTLLSWFRAEVELHDEDRTQEQFKNSSNNNRSSGGEGKSQGEKTHQGAEGKKTVRVRLFAEKPAS